MFALKYYVVFKNHWTFVLVPGLCCVYLHFANIKFAHVPEICQQNWARASISIYPYPEPAANFWHLMDERTICFKCFMMRPGLCISASVRVVVLHDIRMGVWYWDSRCCEQSWVKEQRSKYIHHSCGVFCIGSQSQFSRFIHHKVFSCFCCLKFRNWPLDPHW